MPTIHQQLRSAEAHLGAADPVMGGLIERYGPCGLATRKRDPFHVLCASIISQQLSSRAADTIQARIMSTVGASRQLQPQLLLAAEPEALRAAGLSWSKVKWIRHLAEATDSGTLDFRVLKRMDDESAIRTLDALPGIGRWTAEMFLMFAMHRLDLFAMDDVGLRRGVNQLYGKGRALSDRRTLQITQKWAPYRTVASWYLWRVADPETQTWN
ncbi:DNA-3-methyladenine glycosylase 2 family protein [Sinimarinibacterium sp. CAU 1509]|uniref:DNA-3-methyladenine glycosylase family protein n=1 Tax=Sinimarinibacterium sp. CAU 1509 TaxID=2562283 RepID=UPI0010AC45B3|nr:DNA-3-methyladenine glycosylase [Sinimarinibacterium sp. CAU 1509]TJY65057.1 DNA-3-methyladenine glycosylase 2 family protein [Sinimarinibacterium sp. CAU 1509]